jgi:surface antigen
LRPAREIRGNLNGEKIMSKTTLRTIALLVIIALELGGCAQTGETVRNNPKTTMGGMLGAASGGLIAAAAGGGAAGIVGGVLLGGLVGGAVGNALDQKDKQMAQQAAQQAFENSRTGEASAWRNPDSGNSGSITPTRTYQASSGQYCREYQQDIIVGGQVEKNHGTACRQPDGSWRIQN